MTAGLEVGSPATEAFRAARNQLMGWRGEHRAAVSGFRWPDVGDRFNWAVDWFDAIARGNTRDAGLAMATHLSAVDTALSLIMGEKNA